jgi:hypothetical protein
MRSLEGLMFFVSEPERLPSSSQTVGLSSLRAEAPNKFRPVAFGGKHPSAYLRRLPFANVRTAVHVQHLPSDVRSLGQINHGIHDLLNGRNASHWG